MGEDMPAPHAGALRHIHEDGSVVQANPHDALYSTVTMFATEYFNGTEWKRIYEDDDQARAA